MAIRKTSFWLCLTVVIFVCGLSQLGAIAPVDAVRFQLEHEYSAGRVSPGLRDELMDLLEEVKEYFQSGDEAHYRLHVDAFRERLRNSPSTEIQSDAADRILSVARSLQ